MPASAECLMPEFLAACLNCFQAPDFPPYWCGRFPVLPDFEDKADATRGCKQRESYHEQDEGGRAYVNIRNIHLDPSLVSRDSR